MQIIKRQRDFTNDEIALLESMFKDVAVSESIKAGILLLLDKQKEFDEAFANLSKDDQDNMRSFPIWELRNM